MLDCCKPLEEIKTNGINFEQFACLARCNRLITEKTYVPAFGEKVMHSLHEDKGVEVVVYVEALGTHSPKWEKSPLKLFSFTFEL